MSVEEEAANVDLNKRAAELADEAEKLRKGEFGPTTQDADEKLAASIRKLREIADG